MIEAHVPPNDGLPDAKGKDLVQARTRLIDHFKRVYTIVVGLAITEAVRRLFPLTPTDLPWPALFMFMTFFFTLVPIFHGGDRSLDVKYASNSQERLGEKVSYLWDVYMLLITAILFVCIAEAIPQRSTQGNEAESYPRAGLFYTFMAFMLWFDVFVLLIDRIKSNNKRNLAAYVSWVFANFAFGAVCAWAAYLIGLATAPHAGDMMLVLGHDIRFDMFCLIVLASAIVRTIVDYMSDHVSGGKFLFP